MDPKALFLACLEYEAKHGVVDLILALQNVIEQRAEENGLDVQEDDDGAIVIIQPNLQ